MTIIEGAEKKLAAYKKANYKRRAVIVAKAGFMMAALYIKALENSIEAEKSAGKIKTKEKMSKKEIPTIHLVDILDASGSMAVRNKFNNALKGINNSIKTFKEDGTANYTQTTVVFSYNSCILTQSFLAPIKLTSNVRAICNGSTALYQAIGTTLERLKENVKNGEKVLVKIFTDGGENDSKGIYDPYRGGAFLLSRLIKECEEVGFTITFVGTREDVRNITNALSIAESNTLVHDNTGEGVARSYAETSTATMSYIKSVAKGEDVKTGFYKKVGKLD